MGRAGNYFELAKLLGLAIKPNQGFVFW